MARKILTEADTQAAILFDASDSDTNDNDDASGIIIEGDQLSELIQSNQDSDDEVLPEPVTIIKRQLTHNRIVGSLEKA